MSKAATCKAPDCKKVYVVGGYCSAHARQYVPTLLEAKNAKLRKNPSVPKPEPVGMPVIEVIDESGWKQQALPVGTIDLLAMVKGKLQRDMDAELVDIMAGLGKLHSDYDKFMYVQKYCF
ncbi:MAG: hypothetical protein WCP20_11150 [Desulfuromonadales bacterium]